MDFGFGTLDSLIDGTDPMLQRFGIEKGGPLPDPSILDPLIAGTDPLWLEIQKEADAFIGADGVPSYIAENSNVEVLPLDLGETGEDSVSGTASTYDGSLTEEGAEGFGGFRATYGGPDGDTAGGETPGGPFSRKNPATLPAAFRRKN